MHVIHKYPAYQPDNTDHEGGLGDLFEFSEAVSGSLYPNVEYMAFAQWGSEELARSTNSSAENPRFSCRPLAFVTFSTGNARDSVVGWQRVIGPGV